MNGPESIVFIIDDDAQVRSSLTNLCRSVELNVQSFSSTEEFLNTPRPNILRMAIERDRDRRKQDLAVLSLRKRYDSLTAREREIMHLVTRGLLNKQVAAELNLSEVTVKVHRGRIMQKMEAKSLADLVRMSDQIGSLPDPSVVADT